MCRLRRIFTYEILIKVNGKKRYCIFVALFLLNRKIYILIKKEASLNFIILRFKKETIVKGDHYKVCTLEFFKIYVNIWCGQEQALTIRSQLESSLVAMFVGWSVPYKVFFC
jgi:hypothetical protein